MSTITTRTRQVTTSTASVGDENVPLMFAADEYIEPRIDLSETKLVIIYATKDDDPISPRDEFPQLGTMVVNQQGDGTVLDEPDSEVQAAWGLARAIPAALGNGAEVFYLVRCGCAWGLHGVEQVEAGECKYATATLALGRFDSLHPDGSGMVLDLVEDYDADLDGAAAVVSAWIEADTISYVELAREYLKVVWPDVTGFIEWSLTGHSQGDWAEGYAYTTADDLDDPEECLEVEVTEYGHYWRGDVYMLVREEFERMDDEWVPSAPHDVCGGLYGDDYAQQRVNEGGVW